MMFRVFSSKDTVVRFISKLRPSSHSHQTGLQEDDVLLEIDGTEISQEPHQSCERGFYIIPSLQLT